MATSLASRAVSTVQSQFVASGENWLIRRDVRREAVSEEGDMAALGRMGIERRDRKDVVW